MLFKILLLTDTMLELEEIHECLSFWQL